MQEIEERIGRMLVDRGLTLAVAESCTGGLLGSRLTQVPGSSQYFLGGVIAYANPIKVALLGVDAADLEQHGAVSDIVAGQMAAGVRERTGADLGVSITGIAGPDGGSDDKPVGLVYIGLADAEGPRAEREIFAGQDRESVRAAAAQAALEWIERTLKGDKTHG